MDPRGKIYNSYKTKKHVMVQRMNKHLIKSKNFMAIAANIMFTQMSAKKGIHNLENEP